jgi:hypothetical protein
MQRFRPTRDARWPARRISAASEHTGRKIERDLRDAAQQRLVSLARTVGAAHARVPREQHDLRAELSQIAQGLVSLLDELVAQAQVLAGDSAVGVHAGTGLTASARSAQRRRTTALFQPVRAPRCRQRIGLRSCSATAFRGGVSSEKR